MLWQVTEKYFAKITADPKAIEGTLDILAFYKEHGPGEVDYNLDGVIKITETPESSWFKS